MHEVSSITQWVNACLENTKLILPPLYNNEIYETAKILWSLKNTNNK
jgi:hypothetical protein